MLRGTGTSPQVNPTSSISSIPDFSAQIRTCLLESPKPVETADQRPVPYRELQAKYQLAGEGYHTWPFQPSALSGVSITAGLTLLGNLAAILYRIYLAP